MAPNTKAPHRYSLNRRSCVACRDKLVVLFMMLLLPAIGNADWESTPGVVEAMTTTGGTTGVAQKSTMVSANRYEGVYTTCQDIKHTTHPISAANPVPATNDFSPLFGALIQRVGIGPGEVLSPEKIAKIGLKISELEPTKHGKVEVVYAPSNHYAYIPDKGYLGKDRVVYEIEAHGKRYKATINFWVVPVVWYGRDGKAKPQCLDQKFDDSAIDADSPKFQGVRVVENHLKVGNNPIRRAFQQL